jgi:dTDP-glucose pyrophosphorylase
MKDVRKIFISPQATMEDALRIIQQGGVGIALAVDENDRLLATITDGDIRRAILNRFPLITPVSQLIALRAPNHLQPTVAAVNTPNDQLLQMMEEKVIRQIPLLDEEERVCELALMSELLEEEHHKMELSAVVMAGGKGQRLFPLTKDTPKPMLPIDEDCPIIESIVRKLKTTGVQNIHIATHYKSEVIQKHFGNGDSFETTINYLQEEKPLGTAGALSLMEAPEQTTLVINGDIVTQLDFRTMFDFHKHHQAVMTMGVRIFDLEIPFGVVETDDVDVTGIIEKPVQKVTVNAGIYLLEPEAFAFIPKDTQFHMTELAQALIQQGRKVISFPIQEYWLDVGHPEDYEKAKLDFRKSTLAK